MIKKSLIALALIFSGAVAHATLVPATANAACTNGRLLTLKPWFQGLQKSDCKTMKSIGDKNDDSTATLSTYIWTIVLNIVEDLLHVAGFVTVGFIIYGGFVFLTSGGSPDRANQGRKTVLSAVIGLVVAMASIALINLVAGTALGIG